MWIPPWVWQALIHPLNWVFLDFRSQPAYKSSRRDGWSTIKILVALNSTGCMPGIRMTPWFWRIWPYDWPIKHGGFSIIHTETSSPGVRWAEWCLPYTYYIQQRWWVIGAVVPPKTGEIICQNIGISSTSNGMSSASHNLGLWHVRKLQETIWVNLGVLTTLHWMLVALPGPMYNIYIYVYNNIW